jgi:integrase
MTNKIKFTAKRVLSFTCPTTKQQAFLWDLSTPGLGLRVTRKGRPSYIFQSRFGHKTIRITIGSPSAWSISHAQVKAREYQRLIDEGKDPRHEVIARKNQAAEADKNKILARATFGEVYEEYITERTKHWGDRHYEDHIKMISKSKKKRHGVLLPLLGIPLSEIHAQQIEALVEKEAIKRPARVRLALRHLRAFFRWASEQEKWRQLVDKDAANTRKARELAGRASYKTDHLEKEQLHAWFKACENYPNIVIASYLQCLLLTGARREELGHLQWRDINFQWRSIQLRDKTQGSRSIPLTPYVESLINSLPRRNQWVFSSKQSKSGRLVEPSIAHTLVTRNVGIKISLHGLRRSFKSLTEWLDIPVGVVAQIMGHKPSATAERHYTVRPIDLLRVHHKRIEEWIVEQGGIDYVSCGGELLSIVGKK